MTSQLYFEKIVEPRVGYFVEYQPPRVGDLFATMNLVYTTGANKAVIASNMENELRVWMARYPIPLMVAAFDESGSVISLLPIRPCDDLTGRMVDGTICEDWRLVKNSEFPDGPLSTSTLLSVYGEVPHKTQEEHLKQVEENSRKTVIGNRFLKSLLFTWLVLIPLGIAFIGFASPLWGGVLFVYSFCQGIRKGLILWGYQKPSKQEERDAEKRREMEHFYHHCKRNPQGFQRLKSENFVQDARADIQREAEAMGMRVEAQGSVE